MGATDFEFGWNVADNADPWASQNRAEDDAGRPSRGQETDDKASALSEFHEITCGQVLKMVRQMTYTVRKAYKTDMAIPKPTATKSRTSTGKAPTPQVGESRRDFNPWLKLHNLIGKKVLKVGEKFKMKVLEAREAPEGNISDVIVDVEIKGKSYAWGLSADKKAYGVLYEKFGDRLDRWKGQVNCQVAEPFKKGYNPSIQVL